MIQKIDVPVRMRDGVHLSTDIRCPETGGPFPTIVYRTCYGNGVAMEWLVSRVADGYAVVSQDCRGRFDSEGRFNPFHEAADSHDTIAWVNDQPWCNGRIGMRGGSYCGSTQFAAAWTNPPGLTAIIPEVVGNDIYKNEIYQNGALSLMTAIMWGTSVAGRSGQGNSTTDWHKILRHLPLITMDEAAGYRIDHFREWLAHSTYDSFWAEMSVEQHYGQINVPTFHIGGWYDFYTYGMFRNYCSLRRHAGPLARKHQKILVGPWAHSVNVKVPGHIDFGEHAVTAVEELRVRWLDRWLKGERNGIDEGAPIRIFVMGDNIWRDEYEWPPARMRQTKVYLASGGRANSLYGDGTLAFVPPQGAGEDRCVYDPENPVPTIGGTCLCLAYIGGGPTDHRPIERRDDVLVYTGEVVDEPLEVTGPVRVRLFASSDAVDTDFVARLCDVHPDGRSIVVCDGIVRMRFREGFETEKMMVPGRVYEFDVDMGYTSNTFLPGHALRLEITSSCFPQFDRNLNTGEPLATGTRMQCARQAVYHSKVHPSHLVLPVIPREGRG